MSCVFTNGVFDILHVGHLTVLRFCHELTYQMRDIPRVVVGINSDESVRRLKGSGRPLVSQDERVQMLLAVRWVDDVIVFDEDTPSRLISELRPLAIVKGGDYTPEQVVGSEVVGLNNVYIVPTVMGRSTSELMRRVH